MVSEENKFTGITDIKVSRVRHFEIDEEKVGVTTVGGSVVLKQRREW
jgi:hypothetical protein